MSYYNLKEGTRSGTPSTHTWHLCNPFTYWKTLAEQITQLQRENAELRKQLKSQQSGEIHYHIDHIDTLNLGDNVENKFS